MLVGAIGSTPMACAGLRSRGTPNAPPCHDRKGFAMNVPAETKYVLWGFAGGAAALAFVGFNWGGWVTGGKAEAQAAERANAATVSALAPLCVARFQSSPEVGGNLIALKKTDSWSQGEFVEKGGWATLPGAGPDSRVTEVARACAALLVAA
jgi:hypothetical protein